ncbi:type II toxin-antitoxin system HicA family toxin [Paradesulfitobacterium aromaticivorans]
MPVRPRPSAPGIEGFYAHKDRRERAQNVPAFLFSHIQLTHPTKQGKVTLPNHGGDIPPGTLNSIWRQAGLK